MENGGRILANLGLLALLIFLSILAGDFAAVDIFFALIHRCDECGTYFRISDEHKSTIPRCARCNYNLNGNTAVVCPEFGWEISDSMKRRLQNPDEAETPKPPLWRKISSIFYISRD